MGQLSPRRPAQSLVSGNQRPALQVSVCEPEGPHFFRTREDGWGILQVVGNNTEPPGVKIRYSWCNLAVL